MTRVSFSWFSSLKYHWIGLYNTSQSNCICQMNCKNEHGRQLDVRVEYICRFVERSLRSWAKVKVAQRTTLYTKYKDLILFNKNVIIAGICSFFSAAFVTQLYYTYYDKSHLSNSVVALMTEYSVYMPLFAILFYIDNRHRYVDPLTGKKDFNTIKRDIKKLFTAFSISEIAYSLSKISFTYQFLQLGAIPYQASMIGSLIASAISIVLINFLVIRVVRLVKT